MDTTLVRKKQVLVCETQPLTAEGVRASLQENLELEFSGAFDSLAAASEAVRKHQPDLVLLDKSFGAQALLSWLEELRGGHAQYVVWGNSITEPEALRFLQCGVRGIIRKTTDSRSLVSCLRSVAGGTNWMEDSLFRDSPRLERYPHGELTPREQQVLELVEQGLKNKEIARDLGIRPGTVKIHLKHIFEKTGVRGRYGLALSGLKERVALEMAHS